MRNVYRSVPSEKVLRKELARLSKDLGVVVPAVNAWSRGDGRYDYETLTLNIPNQEWQERYHPDCPASTYWGVVLHEYAHHLDHLWCNGSGHTPEMYALLTALILREDLPMDAYFQDEERYKPQSFHRGRRIAGTAILADFKGVRNGKT